MIVQIPCTVEMSCAVYLSESVDKIKTAIANIFPDCMINYENFSLRATSQNISSLDVLRESIQSRHQQKTYRRTLEKHLDEDSVWFYLNKQAAFAKKVALCGDADESPLGPITVTITSRYIKQIIEWIAGQRSVNL